MVGSIIMLLELYIANTLNYSLYKLLIFKFHLFIFVAVYLFVVCFKKKKGSRQRESQGRGAFE